MTDVFTHPWLSGLFSDDEIATHLDADSQLAKMIKVEAAFTRALGNSDVVDAAAADAVLAVLRDPKIETNALQLATARDGLVVPGLVQQLLSQTPDAYRHALHKGLTSQDVIDTAFSLSIMPVITIFGDRISALINKLETLTAEQGANALMGRTRMQAALSITVADRVDTWRLPLISHLQRLEELRPRLEVLYFGGAVGTRHDLGEKAEDISRLMSAELGLQNPPKAPHAMRDHLAEFASWLSLVTGSLGKMGQDIALMAQQGVDAVQLSGGGGSSAMPHKQNPIRAELLITLARFNASQLSGVHHAMIHEQERSGMAWALEWMLLPEMVKSTGSALRSAQILIDQINRVGDPAP